jgi:prolyl oligopeptidase
MVAIGGNQLLFENQSFVEPPAWFRYDPATGQIKKTALFQTTPADFSDVEVLRQTASSKDGTRVPMTILRRKGTKLDGKNPTLLTAYGGYGINQAPTFSVRRRLWLDHGGVWVVANLRGGGEFGDTWHEQGRLTKKQNVFDDFIACAETLIKAKYTSPDKLVIEGGSNGGLLMGAALTQRPELFRAVVCQVPLLDMLRYQRFQIAKLWIPEYGASDDPQQFEYLHAYSPYHHVKPGVLYPAVLFMTAESDTRVDPMHAVKMAALLQAQAANGPERPLLLRVDSKAGHGVGKPITKLVDDAVDVWSFLFWQLGVML